MANVSSTNVFTAVVDWDDAWAANDPDSGYKWTITPTQNVTLDGADTKTVIVTSTADPQVERTLTFIAYDGAMTSEAVSVKFTPEGISLPDWPPEDGSDLTITIECEIPEGETVYKELDLFIATDLSASMSSWISSYKSAMTSIVTQLRTLGAPDIQVGSTGYGGSSATFPNYSELSYDTSRALSAISAMTSTGSSEPICQCCKLIASSSSWRSTSLNMLVMNSSDWDDSDCDSDTSGAISQLSAKGIKVYSIGPTTSSKKGPLIASGTGGTPIAIDNGVSATAMIGYIEDAITEASTNLTVVLTPDSSMPSGFIKKISPEKLTGVSRGDPSFTFDVTFNGSWVPTGSAVKYSFDLELIADDFAIIETTKIEGTIRR